MKPKPNSCFLNNCEKVHRNGEQRWRSVDGKRLYTWDGLHGDVEVFDAHGYHLGSADAVTEIMTKSARKGRRIDV